MVSGPVRVKGGIQTFAAFARQELTDGSSRRFITLSGRHKEIFDYTAASETLG